MSYLYHKVSKTVDKFDLLGRNDRVLIAVSGGPDSVSLTLLLNELSRELNLDLFIFHLNHMTRSASDQDEEFVESLSKKLGIKAFLERRDVKKYCEDNSLSFQDGARKLRYELMEDLAERHNLNKIATGHTSDDLIETFLMRVIDGSDLRGLTGIPPKRGDKIIRPLIECSKDEILEYLSETGVDFVIDETNQSDQYYRNRIRHYISPLFNDDDEFKQLILGTTSSLRDEESRLEELSLNLFDRSVKCFDDEVYIPTKLIKDSSPSVILKLFRRAFDHLNEEKQSRVGISQLVKILDDVNNGSLTLKDLPGQLSVCEENNQVVIFKKQKHDIQEFELQIGSVNVLSSKHNFEVTIVERVDTSIEDKKDEVFLDSEKIVWPLKIRSLAPGDRFSPLGMSGSKKVKDYFIDEKIPRRKRDAVPIVTDMEKIVWIAGHRLDDRVKIDDETAKVAVLKLKTRE